ncbi:MAG TPA: hydrogenase expression/formation protein HypE [Burkholderiales bacterium]|nr:hydrogenase expression/formation protein HypE [Burkholderiales bacterium]
MMEETRILLAHGNGGRLTRELVEKVFAVHLANPLLDVGLDAVTVPVAQTSIVVTTDGFTVRPLEFPGGDIGALAVHGTVNDLAVAGARPLYMTLNAFIEEGMELAQLKRIAASMGRAAREAGVRVVAGDTKVVPRGEGGGLYLASTGIGERIGTRVPAMERIRNGDAMLVSGPVGDHGIAVLLAREDFGLSGELRSDSASVLPVVEALLQIPGLRFMRDPTRGGLATVANEIARGSGLSAVLEEASIPVRDAVRAVCDILGYDPLYLACEGRVVAVVAQEDAQAALAACRRLPQGCDAALIGRLGPGRAQVTLRTPLGGERVIEELEEDPLPRIC